MSNYTAPTVSDRVAEIAAELALLHEPGEVVEVRALAVPAGRGFTLTASGYFSDMEAAAKAALQCERRGAAGVYHTVNPCRAELLARAANRMADKPAHTTRDEEITGRRWLPIDLDPDRPAGIASTEAELQAARDLGLEIEDVLRGRGWPVPMLAESGNGVWLLYRIDEPNDPETKALVANVYRGLQALVVPSGVKIDTAVGSAAQLMRCPGIVNRKGDRLPDRPHRRAVLHQPDPDWPITVVGREMLEEIAALAPAAPTAGTVAAAGKNGRGAVVGGVSVPSGPTGVPSGPTGVPSGPRPRLMMEEYLRYYGVTFTAKRVNGATAYLLTPARCRNSEHGKDGAMGVFQADDGKLTAECKHSSCAGLTWEEVKGNIGEPLPQHYDRPPEAPRPVPTIPAGTRVRAGDRANIGTVVADNGDTAAVHFVSPTGQQATVELPKSELATLDGRRVVEAKDDGQPPAFTRTIPTHEFFHTSYTREFLVDGVLVRGQPCVIGGRSKAMKTSVATALVLSLASGAPLLGEWPARKCKVGFWSGESGAATIQETARRQAEAMHINPADCSAVWSFDLPRLARASHLNHLARLIEAERLEAVIIDPLYLSLLEPEDAGSVGNVFAMGAKLQPLSELAQATGCTMIVLHHFRKNSPADANDQPELEELSQAGFAEWARQWLLLSRRTPYNHDGCHELWLRYGGSAGHAGCVALTIHEGLPQDGDLLGRRWEVMVERVADVQQAVRENRDRRKEQQAEERQFQIKRKVFAALWQYPQGETERILRGACRLNPDMFARGLAPLINEGLAESCEVTKKRGSYPGYKLTEKGRQTDTESQAEKVDQGGPT